MTVIYGRSEAEERMKRETMSYDPYVSLTHDFNSENPEKTPMPSEKKIIKRECFKKGEQVKRTHKAIGGAAKTRRKYPFT